MSVSRQPSIFCADIKLLLSLASFSREWGAAEAQPRDEVYFIALKIHHVPGLELCRCWNISGYYTLSQGWAILISPSCDWSTECPTDGSTLVCRDNSCPCTASYKAWKCLVICTLSTLWDSMESCLAACLPTQQAKCCSGCQNEKEPEDARPISSDPSCTAFCPSWCAEPQARGWHQNRMSIQGKFFS